MTTTELLALLVLPPLVVFPLRMVSEILRTPSVSDVSVPPGCTRTVTRGPNWQGVREALIWGAASSTFSALAAGKFLTNPVDEGSMTLLAFVLAAILHIVIAFGASWMHRVHNATVLELALTPGAEADVRAAKSTLGGISLTFCWWLGWPLTTIALAFSRTFA